MKKLTLASALALAFTAPAYAAVFTNGGFETGDLSGWTGGGGCWGANNCANNVYVPYTGGTLPTASQYVGGTPNNTIMSGGTDPYTGLSTVYNGKYSARVNDATNNYSVSTLSQSVTNYTDTNMYFQWQAVLESSHTLVDSDYFSLTLRDDTTNTVLLSRSYSSAGSVGSGTGSVTWSNSYNSHWYTSGWVLENIDLAALGVVGHDFTLSVLASDCPYGGHAGYVYVDGFAPVIQPPGGGGGSVPEPATLALLGLGLAGLGATRRRKTA